MRVFSQVDKVKYVRILEYFSSSFGLIRRQSLNEIRYRTTFAVMQASFNLMNENITCPPVFQGFDRIPETLIAIPELVQQDHLMRPRQFGNRRLQNFVLAPRRRKIAHIP